jgi:hypothetical protein
MTSPTNTPDGYDHDLNAMAYLAQATELAEKGAQWASDDGTLAHAQVLATIGAGKALLAVADAIRDVDPLNSPAP